MQPFEQLKLNLADFPEPAFLLDRDLQFITASRLYLELIGRPGLEVAGKPFLKVHPDAGHSLAPKELERCLKQSCRRRFEDYNHQFNLWLEFRIAPHDAGLLVLVSDISSKKYADLAMRESEERWRGILESSPVGIVQMALDGRWQFVNPRVCEIFGLSQADLFGKSFEMFKLPEDTTDDGLRMAEMIAGIQGRFTCERPVIRADGTDVWIRQSISLVRAADGRPKFFVAVIDNIQERKEAEESLQFALQAARMGDWDYNAIQNDTRRSRKFNEIFGFSEPPLKWGYEDFEKNIHPDDRQTFNRRFQHALFKGEEFSFDARIIWPDQSVRWISLRGRVYLNRRRQAVRMAGLIRDITDQKQIEHDVQSARLAAEDANREKSYFLANMSHEIRTPLGAILGFTEALRDPNLSEGERNHYLQILSRNGKALAALIGDILDLSKVEAGYLEVENSKVLLPDLVEEITQLLRMKAEAKRLKLTSEIRPGVPAAIIADPIRLRQILLNIVGNAIKFTREGHVTLCVKTVPGGNDEGQIAFFVSDSGAGIPAESRARLFNPFTQADSSTTRRFGGTGLGLALSRRLARAMGGDVVLAKSKPGEGSTFVILIPAMRPTEQPEAEIGLNNYEAAVGAALKHSNLEGLKILLAEDSLDNQELIKHMLDKKGIDTVLADDGVEAVEKAMDADYDVVLMDMQMPRRDGYSATRELRQAGFEGPIIALTANAMRNDREKCLAAGCSDYLSKPIDANKLYEVIDSAVSHQQH